MTWWFNTCVVKQPETHKIMWCVRTGSKVHPFVCFFRCFWASIIFFDASDHTTGRFTWVFREMQHRPPDNNHVLLKLLEDICAWKRRNRHSMLEINRGDQNQYSNSRNRNRLMRLQIRYSHGEHEIFNSRFVFTLSTISTSPVEERRFCVFGSRRPTDRSRRLK